MKEERYIIEKAGKRNPFRVPDGYFDTLGDRVMASLPTAEVRPLESMEKRGAKTVWLRPLLYAAACLCILFVSVTVWQHFSEQPSAPAAEVAVAETDPFDMAADYMMVDNQDIYSLLADN